MNVILLCYNPVILRVPLVSCVAYVKSESLYINALNMESMTDNVPKPAPLRIVAGVILGIFAGFFIFFAISLLIGMINDILGTSLSMSTKFNEDIWSAVLLVVIIIACTAGVLWLSIKLLRHLNRKTNPWKQEHFRGPAGIHRDAGVCPVFFFCVFCCF